jgi:hypothetical protein
MYSIMISQDEWCLEYPVVFDWSGVAEVDSGTCALFAVVCDQRKEYARHYKCLVGDPATGV